MSSLETKLLEGRAALASTKFDRDTIALELVDAKTASVRVGEQKEEILEAKAREEALRMEVDTIKNALQVTVEVNGVKTIQDVTRGTRLFHLVSPCSVRNR